VAVEIGHQLRQQAILLGHGAGRCCRGGHGGL
jgi:hypothetical protein